MEGTFALDPPPPPPGISFPGVSCHTPLPHPLVRLGTLSKEYYFVAKMLLHDIFKSHTQDTFNFELRCPPWEGRGGGVGEGMDIFWNYTLLKSPLSIICIVFLV